MHGRFIETKATSMFSAFISGVHSVSAAKSTRLPPYHFQRQKPEAFQQALKGSGVDTRPLNWYPATAGRGN